MPVPVLVCVGDTPVAVAFGSMLHHTSLYGTPVEYKHFVSSPTDWPTARQTRAQPPS